MGEEGGGADGGVGTEEREADGKAAEGGLHDEQRADGAQRETSGAEGVADEACQTRITSGPRAGEREGQQVARRVSESVIEGAWLASERVIGHKAGEREGPAGPRAGEFDRSLGRKPGTYLSIAGARRARER